MKISRKLSPKEKNLILLAGGVLAAALLYSLIADSRKGASFSDQKTQAKMTVLKKSLKNLAGYEKIKTEYQRLSKDVPALTTGGDATESMGMLEKMAQECSVFIVSSKPQILQDEEGTKRLVLDLQVRADAGNLAVFLYRLENSTHLLHVKRLTVTASSQNPSQLEAALLLNQLTA